MKRKGDNGRGYGMLTEVYFDMDGKSLDAFEFTRRYPHGRVCVARSSKYAVRLSCEFVGINHEPNPKAPPLIYETIVAFNDEECIHILASIWAPSIQLARRHYAGLARFMSFGGFALYYLKYWLLKFTGKL